MDPIQLFVPTFRVEETLSEIRECLEKGWTGLGFKTVAFEEAWRRYTGLPHAHFLNSATAGLHLAVRLLKETHKWREGDEIISTPLTFVSTNHAILYAGLRPVFADVDEYLCLDPVSMATRVTARTRAIMFVGMGGNTGQLPEVTRLCRERGLKLILDAAHMAGTRWQGGHVGGEADVTVFSFQAVKNLPTADAGMICFAEATLDAEVRKWTWLGINKDTYARTVGQEAYKWRYDVEHEGFKYHGNSIMAAMGLVALKYLDQDNAYRRQVAAWYDELLHDKIERVPVAPGCESSRHLYQILVENRDQIMLALNEQQIYPGVHYCDNTLYQMYAYAKGTCPRALDASNRLISLPLHLRLSHADVCRVRDALRKAVNFLKGTG
ncbi:MAG: DegT/DnrJ/EryC1/StrS family aminotransferase [Deltaproteobacteria bacterium]|nr:DegT/DnrJ/EryC1/StrS family aminotransferase [Deltaproteobacteria bacterium]